MCCHSLIIKESTIQRQRNLYRNHTFQGRTSSPEGGGSQPGNLGRGVWPASGNPTYFRPKYMYVTSLICFKPNPKFHTVPASGQTLTPIRLLKHLRTCLNSRRYSNLTSHRNKIIKVASPKTFTQFQIREHIRYPISDLEMVKNHTLWGPTYLYDLYKGVAPPPRAHRIEHSPRVPT